MENFKYVRTLLKMEMNAVEQLILFTEKNNILHPEKYYNEEDSIELSEEEKIKIWNNCYNELLFVDNLLKGNNQTLKEFFKKIDNVS